ncbi:hypothetical protein AX17_004614 [Amanita inopinata Kibby_2008]|nr:hypothetical protein AX17_004614 [Amanita inopinata Kibby_2008]
MRLRDRRNAILFGHLCSRTVMLNGSRLIWLVLIIWYEVGTYYWSLSSCKWPALPSYEQPAHVLLLSDTQIPHTPYSKMAISQAWRRFLVDMNIGKNWRIASHLKPHITVFLGDMLGSGRTSRMASEYERAAHKFNLIFALPDAEMRYIPGNTDISLGMATKHSKDVKSYYVQAFGPLNQVFSIRNHTFVGLDAPGLVDEDYQRAAQGKGYEDWDALSGGPIEFVRSIATDEHEHPLVLLSHIPLSRPITASCGPFREKDTIHRSVGHGYQSMLGKQTTAFLLETLRPSIVFSGDNHDYCEFVHSFAIPGNKARGFAREVTVKSFSMSRHIRRPGFQLLSLVSPSTIAGNGTSFVDAPCLLPDQGRIYSSIYPTLMIMTMLILFIINKTKMGRIRAHQLRPLSVSSWSSGSPTSGHSTPPQYLDADIWSPRTPNLLLSPRSAAPSSPRTPGLSSGPKLRTISLPSTPHGSPPHHYRAQLGELDEEEESMYPTYSMHHHDLRANDDWTSGHEDDALEEGWVAPVQHASAPDEGEGA